jgi:hypothetical protein
MTLAFHLWKRCTGEVTVASKKVDDALRLERELEAAFARKGPKAFRVAPSAEALVVQPHRRFGRDSVLPEDTIAPAPGH